jgi:rubredoxin
MTKADSEIPFIRGTLIHSNVEGPSQCLRCEWTGVPTYVKGVRSDLCPACSYLHEDEETGKAAADRAGVAPVKKADAIPRNSSCPCGSGKKFKKCHEGREDEL